VLRARGEGYVLHGEGYVLQAAGYVMQAAYCGCELRAEGYNMLVRVDWHEIKVDMARRSGLMPGFLHYRAGE